MTTISDIGCQDFLQNFDNQRKIERSAHGILENRSNTFKVAKHSVKWIFDLVSLANILPLDYIPIFQAIKSVSTIIFESISIVRKGMKIHDNIQTIKLCNRKIEKWEQKKRLITLSDIDKKRITSSIQRKYEFKIEELNTDDSIPPHLVAYQKERMTECLELMKKTDPQAEDVLVQQLSSRFDNKIEKWNQEKTFVTAMVHKSLFGIVTSIGTIALEALMLTAVAFSAVDGGTTFFILKTSLGVGITVLKLSKYLWWHSYTKENKGVMALRSFEYIAVGTVKYSSLSSVPIMQSCLIKGAVGTCLAFRIIFCSIYDVFDNLIAQQRSDLNVEKLQIAHDQIEDVRKKIEEQDFELLFKLKEKYEQKILEAKENLLGFEQAEDQAVSGVIRANISKWTDRLRSIEEALESPDITDKLKVIDDIKAHKQQKLNNWQNNREFHKHQNHKVGAQIVLSIVQIARFVFLGVAVTLALAGIGANLLPGLIVAGVVANVAYLTYFSVNHCTEKKLNKIRDDWIKCPA